MSVVDTQQYDNHACDECGRQIHLFMPEHYKQDGYKQIIDGMCFDASGGYSEFNDTSRSWLTDTWVDGYISLCHDCAARLWSALPRAMSRFGNQLHFATEPYSDMPCCRWGWTWRTVDGARKLFHAGPDGLEWEQAEDAGNQG
jgi:hypothetical protein